MRGAAYRMMGNMKNITIPLRQLSYTKSPSGMDPHSAELRISKRVTRKSNKLEPSQH